MIQSDGFNNETKPLLHSDGTTMYSTCNDDTLSDTLSDAHVKANELLQKAKSWWLGCCLFVCFRDAAYFEAVDAYETAIRNYVKTQTFDHRIQDCFRKTMECAQYLKMNEQWRIGCYNTYLKLMQYNVPALDWGVDGLIGMAEQNGDFEECAMLKIGLIKILMKEYNFLNNRQKVIQLHHDAIGYYELCEPSRQFVAEIAKLRESLAILHVECSEYAESMKHYKQLFYTYSSTPSQIHNMDGRQYGVMYYVCALLIENPIFDIIPADVLGEIKKVNSSFEGSQEEQICMILADFCAQERKKNDLFEKLGIYDSYFKFHPQVYNLIVRISTR